MNPRKGRTPAILALAAMAAGIAWGGRLAHAESPGILSEVVPKLGEGFSPESFVTLDADTISFDEKTGVVLAEGNVEVGIGSRTIRAERIRYDMKSGEAEFVGHVHYEQEGDEFSFDRIVVNLNTELGAMYNGSIRIRSNNYQISSKVMEKTGKRSFFLREGELTTCPCDPEPDWKFGVGRTNLTLDGYAFARDVTFRIRDVPVLWFPWAAFPVKLSRQSGFLIPSVSQSQTKGFEIELPFYWVINRWSDATFTMDAMSKRGYRPEVEYRFVLNNASEGDIRGTQFYDRETRDTRYRYYGENRFRYSEHFYTNAHWDIPSDDQYYVDLVDDEILRKARFVPSRGFAAWKGSDDSQELAVDWATDLQGTPDDNTVQRLPEYTVTILPRSLGNTRISAGGESQATYFYRRAGDREARGRGSAEISRSFALHPSVSFTPFLAADFLGQTPTHDETGIQTAGYVIPSAGASLELDFRKEFTRKGGNRLVHVISPAAGFRWVPAVDQSDIAITDMWSRISRQQQFLFSLYQRLLRVGEKGPSEVAFLELSWAYELGNRNTFDSPYVDPLSPFVRTLKDQIDLASGEKDRDYSGSSDIYGRLILYPAPRWKLSGEMLFDPSRSNFTTAWAGGEWRRDDDTRAELQYRSTRTLAEEIYGLAKFRPTRLVGLTTSANYSIKNQELTDGEVSVTVYPRSDCWSVGFVVHRTTRPDETSYRLTFGLGGIGSARAGM